MTRLYSLGEWTVKSGEEDDFVAAWNDFADWTTSNTSGNTWAKLLRDRDAPRRFISFGPWEDEEAVARWRQHSGFEEHVARIQEHVEAFVPHTMTVAVEVGPATPDP
ncbi:MAG TPA: antibiotic biosynthesis monooxygenase family protein [Nitriliruptorales bacterium]|nr:antibiotic biosynthesis monooxygenase family protein [Nitriliruptorales bacterium]